MDGDRVNAQDWILAGSLALNVLLAGALFFKTALNEMVVTRFKARTDRQRHARELLVELHGRLEPFDANYFLLLFANARDNQTMMDALGPPNIETIKFMARHALDFPPHIRRSIRALREVMEVDNVRELRDQRAIVARSQRVTEQVESLRKEIERLVK